MSPIWQHSGMDRHPFIDFRENHTPPLTQAALGRMLGVGRSYVNRIEAGERKVGLNKLRLIAERTGIPPDAMRPDLVEAVSVSEAAE